VFGEGCMHVSIADRESCQADFLSEDASRTDRISAGVA